MEASIEPNRNYSTWPNLFVRLFLSFVFFVLLPSPSLSLTLWRLFCSMYVQFFVTSALSDLFAVGNTEKSEDEDKDEEEEADEAKTTINTVKHLATFIKSGSAQQQQQR